MYFTKQHKSLIDKLQESHPIAFPKKPAPKVALAHGQHKAIQRILNVNYRTADEILKLWCMGRRYDLACSREGSPRYDVDGNVRGYVGSWSAKVHKEKLDEYYANHHKPKGYVFTPKTKSFYEKFKDFFRIGKEVVVGNL